MRVFRAWTAVGMVVLLFALAIPAMAQNNDGQNNDGQHNQNPPTFQFRSRTVQLEGVVIAIAPNGRGFVLRQPRLLDGRPWDIRAWMVRISDQTVIQTVSNDNFDEDEADTQVAIGDIVHVIGRIVGGRQILAREVTITGQVNRRFGFGFPPFSPPLPPRPSISAPQVFAPVNGDTISGSEFQIVGRTTPGARIHIDVLAETTFRPFATSVDTQADVRGVFVAKVPAPVRFPGTSYRIVVTATVDGMTSVPTTVVVRRV